MRPDWRSRATLDTLRRRAELLARVRSFFADRGVLEVETPRLAAAPVTDPHLQALPTTVHGAEAPLVRYLQTSPEAALKRLIAQHRIDCFEIARAFRDGELGRFHNAEFTILEWYRLGWDHCRLLAEVFELLAGLLAGALTLREPTILSYGRAFRQTLNVDPHRATARELAAVCEDEPPVAGSDRDGLLHYLWSHRVEPALPADRLVGVTGFPAQQAALARLVTDEGIAVAARFEVYCNGLELANGYWELTDPVEQRERIRADLEERRRRSLPPVPVDRRLLGALEHGLPDCAGVAVGFDRVVMLAVGAESLDQVLAFTTLDA